jgi:hypothetical protein
MMALIPILVERDEYQSMVQMVTKWFLNLTLEFDSHEGCLIFKKKIICLDLSFLVKLALALVLCLLITLLCKDLSFA